MAKKNVIKSPKRARKVKQDGAVAKSVDQQAKEEKEARRHMSLKRHRLGRRDSDEKIERGIKCHFGWMSKSMLASKRVDGLLLRERIELDRQRMVDKKGAQRLGPSYWRDLSMKYGAGQGDFSVLPDAAKSLSVSDRLTEPLSLATSVDCRLRTSDTAIAFFQGCAALNGREILGIARTIAGSKYIAVKCQDVLFLEFAKCLARHRWQHCSDDFLAILKEVMDPLLCRFYQRLGKNGVKEETFVETYGPVILLLIPEAPLQAVVNCRRQFGRVMAEVKRVTSSSSLGELLYGYVHGLLNADGLQSHITNALEKLADTKITVEGWNAWKAQMAEEIADYSQNLVLLRKRVIEVEMWGVKVPVNVQSPLLELNCRADAYLKTLSLGKADGLEMLLFETWCFPSRDTPEIKSEVDVDLIRHMQAACKVASEVLTPSVIDCCADVVKLLEGAREALLSLDQSFCLELSFVASSLPASLSASIESRCLALLPTSTLQRSFQKTVLGRVRVNFAQNEGHEKATKKPRKSTTKKARTLFF